MIGDTATRLRNLATRLKTGQYDGADIMEAWIALREFAKYQWQSIETAPKDGVPVLLSNGRYIEIARWEEDAELGRFERGPAWQVFDCEDSWYSVAFTNPTHWMPLPPTHNIQPETTEGAP